VKHSDEFKIRFDETQGIFIRESEISLNWILSEVLGKPDLQITKVSNEEVISFLSLLDKSNLRLPDGQHALLWVKEQVRQKRAMADAQNSETWLKIAERYRYINEQIDMILVTSKDIKEKMQKIKPEQKEVKRDSNEMIASFKPL
jgi:hypothetical protein